VPRVAVIDDEEPVRTALRRLLRSAGLEVETYAGGAAFLAAAAKQPPDCAVLDLHMRGMDGLEVLRLLRGASPAVRVVMITAHDEPATREKCLAAGAAAYLAKPLDDRLLLNAISAALAPAMQARR
jgi:CheY-like chemotaxis protein